ncbi:MAG: transcriptional regulator, partial [Leptolyngbya sp. ERB_1_2]
MGIESMIQSFAAPLVELPDSRQLLEQLYRERALQPFRSGQIIPLRPDELWVVCRGVVVLNTLHPTGDEALLGVATPSMPFGLPLTWISPYQAISLTDVDLLPLTLLEVERS